MSSCTLPIRKLKEKKPYFLSSVNVIWLTIKEQKMEKSGDRPQGHEKGDANCCARNMTQQAGAGSSKNVPVYWIVSDPELLDCPICLEPLTIPVFQCEDGHIVCSVCCGQLSVCPTCSLPVGYIRCRAIEKVLESVKVRCLNTKYGCNETMSYNLMSDHELTCQYMPCSCPLSDCNFIGTPAKLHQHVSVKHRNSVVSFTYNRVVSISLNVNHKFIVLLEEKNADLFILNNMSESGGNVMSVTCIGQPGKKAVVYNLLARSGGSMYKFQSLTRTIQKKEEKVSDLEKDFLLPSDLFGYYGQLNLEVRIYSRK